MLDEAFDQRSSARSVDTGCSHDIGLAQPVLCSDRLKDRELARREVCFRRQMADEHCVGELAGAVQQVKGR